MKKENKWVVLVTILLLALCSSVSLAAEEERYWVKMNPNRFESTSVSAFEQCVRAAKLPQSSVTEEGCQTLKAMLDEEKCEVKMVPDGIRLDLMSTYEKGRPVVVGPMTKKLGREDQATVCDVGNGVTTYFFIGEVSSCGNLAFVVERPEVEEVGRVTEKPPSDNCRWVEDQVSVRTEPGQIYTTAPTIVSGCGGSVVLGGNLYQEPTKQYAQSSARKVCD